MDSSYASESNCFAMSFSMPLLCLEKLQSTGHLKALFFTFSLSEFTWPSVSHISDTLDPQFI